MQARKQTPILAVQVHLFGNGWLSVLVEVPIAFEIHRDALGQTIPHQFGQVAYQAHAFGIAPPEEFSGFVLELSRVKYTEPIAPLEITQPTPQKLPLAGRSEEARHDNGWRWPVRIGLVKVGSI
jgi:hypothetical protein